MSEENPDTTAVPVTNPVKTHVKDPRRVESGRRLARISKVAKARKKAQLEAIKEEEQNVPDVDDKGEGSIVTLKRVGLVVGIAVGSDPFTSCGVVVSRKAKIWRKVNP